MTDESKPLTSGWRNAWRLGEDDVADARLSSLIPHHGFIRTMTWQNGMTVERRGEGLRLVSGRGVLDVCIEADNIPAGSLWLRFGGVINVKVSGRVDMITPDVDKRRTIVGFGDDGIVGNYIQAAECIVYINTPMPELCEYEDQPE